MCHQGILRAHSNGFFTTTGIAKDLWARQEQLSAADATHSKTFLLMTLSGKGTNMIVIVLNVILNLAIMKFWINFMVDPGYCLRLEDPLWSTGQNA